MLYFRQRFITTAVTTGLVATALGLAHLAEAAPTAHIPVPFHRQEHTLSCEVATLKMAFDRYNLKLPESTLIDHLVFDPTSKRNGVWGDPNQGFVGNIDGRMLIDGYGVYAQPLLRLSQRWLRTEHVTPATPAEIARHIAAGRPVIMWGYMGSGTLYQWQTPAGRTITARDAEHTRVVTGFDGPVQAPTAFYLLDPTHGALHWPTAKFVQNWDSLDRMAIVVYPHPQWVRVEGDTKVWEISRDGTTRQWITAWDTFVERGGFMGAVKTIAPEELERYKRGPNI